VDAHATHPEVPAVSLARRAPTLAAAAVLALGASACSAQEAPQPREGVSAQELTGDASGTFDIDTAEVGAMQSLRLTVAQVLTPAAFTATPGDTAGRPLLVVGPAGELSPGQVVQVAGTLRLFSYDELSGQLSLGDRAAFAGRENDKVLVATTVDTDVPGDEQ